jgi:hypothetical protein
MRVCRSHWRGHCFRAGIRQDAKPAADAPDVKDIVVTAASAGKTAQNSSISVTQVSQDSIVNFTPRSQAEVLRAIPGLNVQDTAGPGGNSNIGVRGIPVSTGGSEYVGLQEDGLPVTLFGDIAFGNNDYWIRFDNNVDKVEAVRGGSASTFSSQAPGAVINYVSKTGTQDGGSVGLSQAINYRETRVDFDYGGHLGQRALPCRRLCGGWQWPDPSALYGGEGLSDQGEHHQGAGRRQGLYPPEFQASGRSGADLYVDARACHALGQQDHRLLDDPRR